MFNKKIRNHGADLFDSVHQLENTFFDVRPKDFDPEMVKILQDVRDSSLRLLTELRLVEGDRSDSA